MAEDLNVLALDISKRATGWTGQKSDGTPIFGTLRDVAIQSDLGRAGMVFSDWLCDMIDVHKPDLIGIEAPAIAGSGIVLSLDEAMLLIGLAFLANVIAAMNGCRFQRVAVQTVRKHFVGHGRPANPKAAVMARCKQLGWKCANTDESDSAALWFYLKATNDPGFRLVAEAPLST